MTIKLIQNECYTEKAAVTAQLDRNHDRWPHPETGIAV